jgi:hypothetical protein
MKTWAVRYVRIPTNHNPDQSALVEAETSQDAFTLVRRQLGDDRVQLANYVIDKPVEYNPKPVNGKILSMDHRG